MNPYLKTSGNDQHSLAGVGETDSIADRVSGLLSVVQYKELSRIFVMVKS